jgi:hypothetical protein
VASVPNAATSHQAAARVRQACQAPATASALKKGIRFGFQMKVDSSTLAADTARRRAATRPAAGPAIDRASHHTIPTAATPRSAISPTTTVGLPAPSHAAGASR